MMVDVWRGYGWSVCTKTSEFYLAAWLLCGVGFRGGW